MPITPAIRCEHCFAPVSEGERVDVRGTALCPVCAYVAGPPLPPADDLAHRVCEAAGVPLGPDVVELGLSDRIAERGLISAIRSDIDAWCQGRWWLVRVPMLLFFGYVWARHATDPRYQSVFKGLNLGVHELGHYVFAPLGEMISALGGSLLQCLVPLIGMLMFARQRDYFAIAFAFGWLATNYFELAVYVGDAVAKQLPLVTPGGGEPIHDWNYILGNYGWLRHTETIAGLHTFVGHACMAICLVSGSWVVGKMFRSARSRHTSR